MGTVNSQGVCENPIQIIYQHLPILLLIIIPTGKKKKRFFKDATQKSASVVQLVNRLGCLPRRPIFEKCSHLREKGGVLTLRTPHWVCADPYSRCCGPVQFTTVPLLNSPWSSPKKIRFRKFRRSYSNIYQNLLRITNPVSDLTGDQ
jgi:hypothetical protein